MMRSARLWFVCGTGDIDIDIDEARFLMATVVVNVLSARKYGRHAAQRAERTVTGDSAQRQLRTLAT